MNKILILPFILLTSVCFSQKKITWNTLAQVKFTDKYFEEVDSYYYYPHFGKFVQELEGKEVVIKGYMLIMGPKSNMYLLSRYPYAQCFFCGGAGPESVIELELKEGHPKYRMDQLVEIKGILKLNRDDIKHCNYIFEAAEEYIETN